MMKKAVKKAVFEGEITALQPIFHNSPDTGKRCLKMSFASNGGIVEVPIISPNTIRAIIRDNIAKDIVEKIGEGKLDYLTLLVLFSGGIIDKETKIPAKQKINGMIALKENNIVVSMLGGSANVMIHSKTITSPCILICKETAEGNYVSRYASDVPCSSFVSKEGLSFIRREDMLDVDVSKYLSLEGMEDLFERMKFKPKKEKSKEDGENEQEKDKQEGNGKRTGQMVYGIEDYVVAGSRFYHRIEILSPKEEEIGAIYGALSRFAERPVIGSYISKGFGNVSAHYTLTVDDSVDVDNLNVTQNGFVSQDIWGFWEKYKDYINNVTIEKISVPKELYAKEKDTEDKDSKEKDTKKKKKEK